MPIAPFSSRRYANGVRQSLMGETTAGATTEGTSATLALASPKGRRPRWLTIAHCPSPMFGMLIFDDSN